MPTNDLAIKYFQEQLLKWFIAHQRSLPWRNKSLNDYQIIIAEVLLQRTKAETVAWFYPIFLKKFPTWQSLDETDIMQIENFLKPVGLYRQRAKGLSALALEMSKLNFRYQGRGKSSKECHFSDSTSLMQ